MTRHVLSIAKDHLVGVQYCRRPTEAVSQREADEITIAPIKSEISYATALHELGHMLGRQQWSRVVIVRERWAWKWAKRNALVWTPRMERDMHESLAWYAELIRSRTISATIAPTEHFDENGANPTDLRAAYLWSPAKRPACRFHHLDGREAEGRLNANDRSKRRGTLRRGRGAPARHRRRPLSSRPAPRPAAKGRLCGLRASMVRQFPNLPTWAMMLIGFAGLSFAGYRRAKNAAKGSSPAALAATKV
jgi:hypothetical protein